MTNKEYLEQVENIDMKIKSLAMQEVYLRNKRGSEKSLHELRDLIENMSEKFIELQKKITVEIYSMKNSMYSAILGAKYLSGATWEEVAAMIGYSDVKYVRTVLHEKALKEFKKI